MSCHVVFWHLGKYTHGIGCVEQNGPKCGDCGNGLPGVPALRPRKYATLSKRQKTVQRAYGGSRCAGCVKNR